jgi:PAS domain-containing protein
MTVCVKPRARAAGQQPVRAGVQPSGFLLGLSSDWRVHCASANLAEFIGIEADEIRGRPISSFLTETSVHLIRNRVALLRDENSPERLIDQKLTPGGRSFDASLRLLEGEIVLEAVPGTDPGGIDVAGAVERMLKRIEEQSDVEQLAEAATRELRGLTGFDSIEIYRNGSDVPKRVASSLRSGVASLEPSNVRPAVLRRPLWVADIGDEAVPILCAERREAGSRPALLAPPEAGLAEAIQVAGARSAVILPIAGRDEPWGFALALHRSARAPRLARLSAAELFAHILGLKIQALESQL